MCCVFAQGCLILRSPSPPSPLHLETLFFVGGSVAPGGRTRPTVRESFRFPSTSEAFGGRYGEGKKRVIVYYVYCMYVYVYVYVHSSRGVHLLKFPCVTVYICTGGRFGRQIPRVFAASGARNHTILGGTRRWGGRGGGHEGGDGNGFGPDLGTNFC